MYCESHYKRNILHNNSKQNVAFLLTHTVRVVSGQVLDLKCFVSLLPGRRVHLPADGLLLCQRHVPAVGHLLPDLCHRLVLRCRQAPRLSAPDAWLQDLQDLVLPVEVCLPPVHAGEY